MVYRCAAIHRRDYGPDITRLRRDHARSQSSDTAIAGFDRGTEPDLRIESQDRREVEETRWCGRRADGAERAAFLCSRQTGGGAGG